MYGTPAIAYVHEYPYITASERSDLDFMFTATDIFGEELVAEIDVTAEDEVSLTVSVSVTDDVGNVTNKVFDLINIGSGTSYFALYDGDTFIGHMLVTIGSSYDLPIDRTGYTFVS